MMRTNAKVTNEEKIFQHDKLIVNGQSQETLFLQGSPFKAVFLNPGPGLRLSFTLLRRFQGQKRRLQTPF